MKIITDSAANLSAETAARLNIEIVPFHITFMGKTYRDGVDLTPADLYHLYLQNPGEYSTTSQPSVGDFSALYQRFPGEEILSIHLSSGLSGTYASAHGAAHLLDDQRITVVDTKTVGPALGWMVEVAAHGAALGWPREQILAALRQVRESTLTMVAFSDMRYLLRSGRISHLKGFVASLLGIKPIIGMNDADGRYSNVGQERTLSRLVQKMASVVIERFGPQKLRLQFMHGDNLPDLEQLRQAVNRAVDGLEDPLVAVTAVLGAHAGPTVIGLAAMPMALSQQLLG